LGHGGRRADIVATMGPLVRVVEAKTSFSSALLEQAWAWLPYANMVDIAVPLRKKREDIGGHRLLEHIRVLKGIGRFSIEVSRGYKCGDETLVHYSGGKLFRVPTDRLRMILESQPESGWGEAGNARGEYYTPWKDTCRRWERYVRQHPGCSLKEAMDACGHHYGKDSTARACMSRWLSENKVSGIRVVRDGRLIKLHPEEKQ